MTIRGRQTGCWSLKEGDPRITSIQSLWRATTWNMHLNLSICDSKTCKMSPNSLDPQVIFREKWSIEFTFLITWMNSVWALFQLDCYRKVLECTSSLLHFSHSDDDDQQQQQRQQQPKKRTIDVSLVRSNYEWGSGKRKLAVNYLWTQLTSVCVCLLLLLIKFNSRDSPQSQRLDERFARSRDAAKAHHFFYGQRGGWPLLFDEGWNCN